MPCEVCHQPTKSFSTLPQALISRAPSTEEDWTQTRGPRQPKPMSQINLQIDVLRTFVVGHDLGSFARAAAQLGRSTSAISLQMRKLEEQVGKPLFRKEGRGLALTQAGEVLLAHARRLVELNDAALAAVRGPAVTGHVRLGMPQDFTETWLPAMLARFAKINPDIRVDVVGDRNAILNESLARGDLDLALLWGDIDATPSGHKVA